MKEVAATYYILPFLLSTECKKEFIWLTFSFFEKNHEEDCANIFRPSQKSWSLILALAISFCGALQAAKFMIVSNRSRMWYKVTSTVCLFSGCSNFIWIFDKNLYMILVYRQVEAFNNYVDQFWPRFFFPESTDAFAISSNIWTFYFPELEYLNFDDWILLRNWECLQIWQLSGL